MIFVDSSVWIDYFNGQQTAETNKLDHLLGEDVIILGDLVLAEVLKGFRHDKDYRTAKSLLKSLKIVEMGGEDIAIKSADNFRQLRKQGVTIRKTIDVFIASYCIENGIPLLHADKDFNPFHQYLGLLNALNIQVH